MKYKGNKWVIYGLIERGKEIRLNLIRKTKAREGRTPLLKVNNLSR